MLCAGTLRSPLVRSVMSEPWSRWSRERSSDLDLRVARALRKLLEKISNRRAVEPLVKALGDSDYRVRWNAAKALRNIGDGSTMEPLIRLLNDKHRDVRERCRSPWQARRWQRRGAFDTSARRLGCSCALERCGSF